MTPLRLRSIFSRKFEERRTRLAIHALESGRYNKAKLKVHATGMSLWEIDVENGTYTIGRKDRRSGSRRGPDARRKRRGNFIWMNHDTISNVHAELDVLNDRCFLRDLESTNGTFIDQDGERVRFAEGYVEPDQTIYLGEYRCTIRELLDMI